MAARALYGDVNSPEGGDGSGSGISKSEKQTPSSNAASKHDIVRYNRKAVLEANGLIVDDRNIDDKRDTETSNRTSSAKHNKCFASDKLIELTRYLVGCDGIGRNGN